MHMSIKLVNKVLREVIDLRMTKEELVVVSRYIEESGMKKNQLYRKAVLFYIKHQEANHG